MTEIAAGALTESEPTTNGFELAREFAVEEASSDGEPRTHTFGNLATESQPAPSKVPPPPARHVTKEAMKAETALRSLAQRAEVSIGLCRNTWADKRRALIRALPVDVAAVLVAGGVLTEQDDLEAVDDGISDGGSDA